jgi:hypothetical protein
VLVNCSYLRKKLTITYYNIEPIEPLSPRRDGWEERSDLSVLEMMTFILNFDFSCFDVLMILMNNQPPSGS